MLRLILTFAGLLPAVALSAASPMLADGKTWWYETETLSDGRYVPYNYGITVDGTESLDGTVWTKLYFVDSRLHKSASPVALMREADGKVYYRSVDFGDNKILHECLYPTTQDDALVYDFGLQPGGAYSIEVTSGTWETFTLGRTDEATNSGHTYLRQISSDNSYIIVEGIGLIDEMVVFCCPFKPVATRTEGPQRLQWVTDAACNILYEADGGLKLWETNGVPEIATDGTGGIRADGTIITNCSDAPLDLSITDASGRCVATTRLDTGAGYDCGTLSPGIYVATASDGRTHSTLKIII